MTAVNQHPTMIPSQVRTAVMRCINAKVVPFIQSSPGLGKSSLVRQIAEMGKLKVIDLRLSQLAPEDLQGLPMRTTINGVEKSAFLPFDTFPLDTDAVPDGYNGWLLFLDEFNSASKTVQAAAYKLVLDRMTGNHKLHPKVAIVCAGNKAGDRAIVNSLGTAMQSRVIHIHMIASKDEWMTWAMAKGIDYRVTGFIDFQPTKLHMFNPDHQDSTFPCPRTWEFVSNLIKNTADVSDDMTLLSGAVSAGVALEFVRFCENYTKIPSLASILADPANAPIPTEMSTRFATLSMLAAYSDGQNIKEIIKYMKRFRPEEELIFYRNASARDPYLKSNPDVLQELVRVMHFVNNG